MKFVFERVLVEDGASLTRLRCLAALVQVCAVRRLEDDDVADLRVAEVEADAVDEHAWPTSSVGSIDWLGIRNGLTRNAWMTSARPRAIATIVTSSMSEFLVDSLAGADGPSATAATRSRSRRRMPRHPAP